MPHSWAMAVAVPMLSPALDEGIEGVSRGTMPPSHSAMVDRMQQPANIAPINHSTEMPTCQHLDGDA